MAWLSGYLYRKSLSISHASGALTNYQLALRVYYGAGTDGTETLEGDTIGKIYCNSKCQTDFEDIRITASDGETLQSVWQEDKTDSDNALYWIKFSSIGTGATTFYVYYGNAGATYPYLATAKAHGQAAWNVFDDFEDESLDTDIWEGDTGLASESGGVVIVTGTESAYKGINTKTDFDGGHRLRGNSKMLQAAGQNTYFGFFEPGSGGDSAFFAGSAVHDIYVKDEGSTTVADYTEDESAYSTKEVRWEAGTHAVFVDIGSVQATVDSNVPDGTPNLPGYIGVYTDGVAIAVAWVGIGLYDSTAPAWGDWGSEETIIPSVTTNAVTDKEATTATLNGEVTAVNDTNITERGFVWDTETHADPGNTDPDESDYANNWTEEGTYGVAAFAYSSGTYSTGTTYYVRACAENDGGYWGYGDEVTFLTKPAAPTNVAATDGAHTDKVVVTWTKSTGASGYKVYEGENLLDTLGDVATFDDEDAAAGTITPGAAVASDGTETYHVVLSVTGESTSNGASRTYKVIALNATGDSAASDTDTGYRGVGAITYQWQRSAADSDADYSNITGGTTDPYNDTGAPSNEDGRYYQCVLSATGAANQTTTANRGYRGPLPTNIALKGIYNTELKPYNYISVLGTDEDGYPIYGGAEDADEIALTGQRFQTVLNSNLRESCSDVAEAILDKMGLVTSTSSITAMPNVGQELWDVVYVKDTTCGKDQFYRVAKLRFIYDTMEKKGTFQQILTLVEV